jgi:hypothetical protein
MEFATKEAGMAELGVASVENQIQEIRELHDFQLAYIGGGSGDTIAH